MPTISEGLELENAVLRELLTKAGRDAARLLVEADIVASEGEAAKQLQALILEEVHHRIKNTLATVIAITSQTLRSSDSLENGRLAVEARLLALARAQDLLLEVKWKNAKLKDVIQAAIEPFENHAVRRFLIHDTRTDIDATAVLPLTMTLNELCTNAVKYGALSNMDGRIEITSLVNEKSQYLKLTWVEKGGPSVAEPTRLSFGTRLITRLADQLHGKAHLRYLPAGLVYELDVPMSSLLPTPEN